MNYQLALEQVLNRLDGQKPKLLLHCCCAVCSSYVLEYLSQYFQITAFFYNPNIFPSAEYERRKQALLQLISSADYPNPVDYLDMDYAHEEFLSAVQGLEKEPEGGGRCTCCFTLRLDRAAQVAQQQKADYLCTTLTISPHKNATVINAVGQRCADRYGVQWLPGDFKKKDGFRRAGQLTAAYGLYRQNYCGCEFAMSHLTGAQQ